MAYRRLLANGSTAHQFPMKRIGRQLIVSVFIASTLNLQGCANTAETFVLGGVVGAVAGVTAVVCAVTCR